MCRVCGSASAPYHIEVVPMGVAVAPAATAVIPVGVRVAYVHAGAAHLQKGLVLSSSPMFVPSLSW